MNISGIIQFILGFILGCLLLVGGTGAIAYFMLTRLADAPPKPVFSEEKPQEEPPPVAKDNQPAATTTQAEPVAEKPEPEPEPKPEPEKLEPGAYKAKVTWSTGLSLRSEPNPEAERIGGVAYNQTIVILEESSDKQWQKIRFLGGETTGWVKAGNVRKLTEEEE